MMPASVVLAMLLLLSAPAAFAGEPQINIEAVCHARSADARMLQAPPDQSDSDCAHDEENARRQLATLWASTSVSMRNRCESDARSLGTMSYLDLLSCIQIAEDTKSAFSRRPEQSP